MVESVAKMLFSPSRVHQKTNRGGVEPSSAEPARDSFADLASSWPAAPALDAGAGSREALSDIAGSTCSPETTPEDDDAVVPVSGRPTA